MKSLTILKRESAEIQSQIGNLLSEKLRFDHSIKNSHEIINKVTALRQNLAVVQRELRERLSA